MKKKEHNSKKRKAIIIKNSIAILHFLLYQAYAIDNLLADDSIPCTNETQEEQDCADSINDMCEQELEDDCDEELAGEEGYCEEDLGEDDCDQLLKEDEEGWCDKVKEDDWCEHELTETTCVQSEDYEPCMQGIDDGDNNCINNNTCVDGKDSSDGGGDNSQNCNVPCTDCLSYQDDECENHEHGSSPEPITEGYDPYSPSYPITIPVA